MIYGQPLLQTTPAQVDPIKRALDYLYQLGLTHLEDKAQLGVHIYNPYHNLTHELLVVYHSLTAYWYAHGGYDRYDNERHQEASELAIAALFHDHNHSGGSLTDDLNIDLALAFVRTFPDMQPVEPETLNSRYERVSTLIRSTMFLDGKFPNDPESFSAQCLRDADLCSIYTTQGQLLLMELPREMGGPAAYKVHKAGRQVFFAKNKEFLKSAQMYTAYGKLMQDFHLDRACQDFEDLVGRATSDNYVPAHSKWMSQQ
jgi:hypothetical protein